MTELSVTSGSAVMTAIGGTRAWSANRRSASSYRVRRRRRSLGGPVAINESVVDALATATGLAKTTAEAPSDGIVRAAGGDRFATARAVADLLAAYNPAYLPVDATALGAIDAETAVSAETAEDSDLLDGMDSTDFALSDQSCGPGELVSEIDAAGTIVCTPDQDEIDGGDAAALEGLAANALTRVGFNRLAADFSGSGTATSVTINSPVDGFLHITSSLLFHNTLTGDGTTTTDRDTLDCEIYVAGDQKTESGEFDLSVLAGTYGHCTDTWVEPVTAGDHLVEGRSQFTSDSTTVGDATLSVIFSPFDANGDGPVFAPRLEAPAFDKQVE